MASTLKPKAQAYIGSGQTNGITVETSHQQQDSNWSAPANAINTINGSGNDFERNEAVRFLMQATLGFEKQHVDDVVNAGVEAWIDQQIQMPYNANTIWDKTYEHSENEWSSRSDFDRAWWDYMMKNEDLLRHRVALALSEIFVISRRVFDIDFRGDSPAAYYDMLAKNALGNFEDLLLDVTLSPVMGHYLSHLGNKKANPVENTFPDQNFAREVMQLFSIGLEVLNADGSPVLDANGTPVPTYNNQDIAEFAKVFTGLRIAAYHPAHYFYPGIPGINSTLGQTEARIPMVMEEDYHEPGPKYLLNGYVIPAGQSGMQDVEDAINHLFMHQNAGPFMGKKLIQFLVKSNPSPQYIERITQVFNNNGNGIRGDMGAVIKAILLDEEARNCYGNTNGADGKLKEPLIRYIFYKMQEFPQYIFNSPSVFNFYQPHYTPNGCISDQNLVAPEFQIHNSLSSITYINFIDRILGISCDDNLEEPTIVLMKEWSPEGYINYTTVNMDYYVNLAKDEEALINELDTYFTHGNLSHETRLALRTALNSIDENYYNGCDFTNRDLKNKVAIGLYLIALSPDYAIIR